eukprot:12888745-Prorocentrum_lima.AAC.1
MCRQWYQEEISERETRSYLTDTDAKRRPRMLSSEGPWQSSKQEELQILGVMSILEHVHHHAEKKE